jgi:hypothetical protein
VTETPPQSETPRPRRGRAATIFWRLGLGVMAAGLAAFVYVDRNAPLDPSAPPHLFTPLQLRLMKIFPERCPAALARAKDVAFTPAPRPMEDGCGYPDGVLLTRSQVSYGGSVLLSCPAAVALVMWERNVLQQEAEKAFGRRVSSVQTFGTYSCRNIYHRENARRSQHALANAVDVAGFTIEGGQRVSVLRDWKDEGARGSFVRAVRDGACGFFGTVLSPDYNVAHADHLHLDMGRWMVCR